MTLSVESFNLATRWPLVFELDLRAGDQVVVAGCYTGGVMELLLDAYPGVRVAGFDPQPWAVDRAEGRLEATHPADPWSVFICGLGVETATRRMGEWNTDACSFVNVGPESREQGEGQLFEFGQAMALAGVDQVDLFVCNMEGYEYDLLPHLDRTGWLDRIGALAVQWHEGFGNDAGGDELRRRLSELYGEPIVEDFPVWTYWRREPRRNAPNLT